MKRNYAELQQLAATHFRSDQGVFVQGEDGTILVTKQEGRPVHPASVIKVATTLALLERLGLEQRLETRFVSGGPVIDGSLHGDLVVRSYGDPFFVSQTAFLMLRNLHAQGLHEFKGEIRVKGPLIFNWKSDPKGDRLKRALQVSVLMGEPSARLNAPSGKTLVTSRSPSLMTILKILNGYSYNVFHLLSYRIGGPQTVEEVVRKHLPPAFTSEVTIANAAGAGELDRLSPRAAVTILWELRRQLRALGKDLPCVLPVNGLDAGTLEDRLDKDRYRACIVGKTGTLNLVSALAGVLRTRKFGAVVFAVLNNSLPLLQARRRQDEFLRALIDLTDAEPWPYVPNESPMVEQSVVASLNVADIIGAC